MSWPVTTYRCKKCDFETGDLHTWGAREYVMPNGVRMVMDWALGWCQDCNNICPVELLDYERHNLELSYAEADLKAFGTRPGVEADAQTIANWNYLAGIVENARDALRVITERKKPLHCLTCGSERVTPWLNKIDGKSKPVHGPCGECFESSEDDFRIALKQSFKRYTLDGDFIAEVDVSGYSVPDPENHEARETSNAQIRGLVVSTKPTVERSRRPWWSSVWSSF